MSEQDICCICLELTEKKTVCGHLLCRTCDLLLQKRECPVCRGVLHLLPRETNIVPDPECLQSLTLPTEEEIKQMIEETRNRRIVDLTRESSSFEDFLFSTDQFR